MKNSWFYFEPCGFSEFPLPIVERQECSRLGFQCDGYMEEVDRPLSFAYCMRFAQCIRAAKDISPFNRRVNQNTVAEVLVELSKREMKLRRCHVATRGHISQGVAHFDAMKRSKDERETPFGQE